MCSRIWCIIIISVIFNRSSFCQDTLIHQKSEDVFNELSNQKLTLRFFNALNGSGIANANVTIEGIGDLKTDAEGKVLFTPSIANGKLYVSFRAKGYVNSDFNVEIMAGTIFFNRFSVSPNLLKGVIRIVLDWDQEPRDLDAHLIKQGSYHISFRDMRSSDDDLATLDHDASNGYGPETITLNNLDNEGKYEFYVHNFSERQKSNSTGLSRSKATVKVFSSLGLEKIYQVPTEKIGIIWKVFRIHNGEIIDVDEMSN